jgi:hypothetical protein
MRRKTLALLGAVLLSLAANGALFAEEQPTLYTRIELWQVKREMWSAFVKNFETYDQPVMEKLMAAGVISEWGIDATSLHQPDGYTHSTWYSAPSYEALAKVDAAYAEQAKAQGDKESARLDAQFAAMITKHRDYLMNDIDLHAVAAKLDHAVLYEGDYDVRPEQGDAALSYWNEQVKPTYQKLMDAGVILSYGLAEEEIATQATDGRASWYVVKNAAGIDQVKAAFKDLRGKMTGEQKRQRWAGIKEAIDVASYRQYMTDVIHWAIAKR